MDNNINYIYISTIEDINKINLLKKEHKYLPYVRTSEINNNDLKNNKQFLPRYDCNLFPNGKAS